MKHKALFPLIFILLLRLLLTPALAEIRDIPFITIYAASSLTLPLTEIIRHYSATHDITINAAYDSSSELAKRIEEGNGTDIFISAHPEWIQKLKKQGLATDDNKPLLSNKLAIITASDSPLASELSANMPLKELLTAISNRAIMVIGDPDSTPLGAYTKETLQNFGLWKKFEPMVIRAANARIALHLIAQGKTVGISYLSDATLNPEVKILAIIPDASHSPITYQMAIISEDNLSYAKEFITFLQSDTANAIFTHYGFLLIR